MGADELDGDDAGIVGHGCDHTISVALDIEDDASSLEDARVSLVRLDVCWSVPLGVSDLVVPGAQGLLGIRMSRPEIAQGLQCDDSHGTKASTSR